MSDYDLTMSPDELKASNSKGLTEINRMKDSLDLFSTLVNWKKKNYLKNSSSQRDPLNQKQVVEETFLFADVSIILFLNKQDLFEEKFYQSSIKYFFEDYNEKSGIEEAKDFIAKKFLACEKSSRKDIYWHYTCALDTKNIETVIAVVRDSILTIMTQKMRIE
jgi:guanine nucleotide-binding protein subunit alpha